MILSQKNIEEIAAAVTKDFNVFYFGCDSEDPGVWHGEPRLTSSPGNILEWLCRLPDFPQTEAYAA